MGATTSPATVGRQNAPCDDHDDKGAVHLLTRQLATESAKHRINVNCIAPSVSFARRPKFAIYSYREYP
jgi:NAD(P)-dependent dehydrogenase (short-subunit alcohol dehydrogenase family)